MTARRDGTDQALGAMRVTASVRRTGTVLRLRDAPSPTAQAITPVTIFTNALQGVDHPFAREQREGVFPERRLEWLMQRAHG